MKTMRQACNTFLNLLDDQATHPNLFIILSQEAEKRGLHLRAEQRGIAGTFIHFKKDKT